SGDHRDLPSFPTRRSSDLATAPLPTMAEDLRASAPTYISAQLHYSRAPNRKRSRRIVGPDPHHRLRVSGVDVGVRRRLACWKKRSEEHTSELQSLAYLVCR